MNKQSSNKPYLKKYWHKVFAICFWLILWELLSLKVGEEIFLASPFSVTLTLVKLCVTLEFWMTILFSSLRIIVGFVLAISVGTLLAIISHQNKLIQELVSPIMKIVKAMPVASFIILALLWINSKNLSVLISFLMVLPMIYANVAQGIRSTDEKLLQMAKVYRLSLFQKINAIYLPSVMPYFISAISVGLGFCWKAGIAAEVISNPTGSIGRKLYEAKLYLMTKELFAWTVVIIAISVIFEKLIMVLLRKLHKDTLSQDIHING